LADNYDQYSRDELLRLLRERDRKPKFGLVWERDEIEHDKSLNDDFVALDFDPDLSCGDAPFENLIIEGDNFDALRYLRMTHSGRIKCIYIDPPYNTGNRDFIYNDRFVDKDDVYKHSKWLEFIYRRLVLAKDLLSDDGVVFVSIDDNEMLHLGMLMDHVFGEANRIATIIWNTEGNTDNQFEIKVNHEYVLLYVSDSKSKSKAIGRVIDPNTREDSNLWKGFADNNINKNNPANPPAVFTIPEGFPSKEQELFYQAKTVDQHFFERTKNEGVISDKIKTKYGIEKLSGLPVKLDNLIIKDHKVTQPCRVYGGFANRKKLEQFVKNKFKPVESAQGAIEFYINANAAIRYRKIVETPSNILSVLRGFGTTERMRGELHRMGIKFDYPKPVDLIAYLLRIGAEDKNSLIFDFFSGSGTTAHAVMKLNAEDGGKRRFILVSSTEATGDAADKNICRDVCAERVRRVMQGYTNKKGESVDGLGGSFAYLRTKRIPASRVFNDIQHEQVWRALLLMHGIPLTDYDNTACVQLADKEDDKIIYMPRLNEQALDAVMKQASLGGRLVVYSWQPGQIRQRVESPNVVFERIPEFLSDRFGGGK